MKKRLVGYAKKLVESFNSITHAFDEIPIPRPVQRFWLGLERLFEDVVVGVAVAFAITFPFLVAVCAALVVVVFVKIWS